MPRTNVNATYFLRTLDIGRSPFTTWLRALIALRMRLKYLLFKAEANPLKPLVPNLNPCI